MGMGNASFWIQSILTDQIKLPTQDEFIGNDHLRRQLGPLVWDTKYRRFRNPEEVEKYFDDLRSINDFDPEKIKMFFDELRSTNDLNPEIIKKYLGNRRSTSNFGREKIKKRFDDLRSMDDFDPEKIKIYFDYLRSMDDFDPSKCSYDDSFRSLTRHEFCKKMQHHKLKFKNKFSYDVVFSLDNLAKGLGLEENSPRDMIQGMVEEKLGIYRKSDWAERPFFDYWIIFNAREQKLEVVYGMKAEDLRMLIGGQKPIDQLTDPAQRDARAHIINAFSMMNADGSEPHSIDFHSFRGAFTPEFYPRRFALKDSIYAQRLDLLAYLLRHVLHRYATCSPPVKYCEFSVGCGDLSRPWVLDVLSMFSQVEQRSGKFKTLAQKQFPWLNITDFEKSVDYRFLAGFNRQISQISNAYGANEGNILLFEVPHYAIHIMFKEFYRSNNQKPTIIFAKQVQQLQKMKEENKGNPNFFNWVVGLDACGDELGHPYCPFIAYEFIEFVKEARRKNMNFGIRIHCAENVPFIRPELPGYRLFAAHMYILYRCIDFLKRKLKSHIRIGHGIAFDKLLSIDNHKYRKSSVLVEEIKRNAKALFSSIPFEVCQTDSDKRLVRRKGFNGPNSQKQRYIP
ncbi:unnamed protein product [Adineta steineri]|uniref:Uncharacterized protein n=1 Tax=Adineta steineri TaxID=433720 RepID=A0A815RJW3_9BILA|nr:unnamed protein product [Adineta steineri]